MYTYYDYLIEISIKLLVVRRTARSYHSDFSIERLLLLIVIINVIFIINIIIIIFIILHYV